MDPLYNVHIFWDLASCPIGQRDVVMALQKLRSIAHKLGDIKTFKAYIDAISYPSATVNLYSDLTFSGITVIHCPHNGKNATTDRLMMVDMVAHAIDHQRCTFLVVTGDRNLAYAVSLLRLRKYRVVVVAPRNVHPTLTAQASESIDWDAEILKTNVKTGTQMDQYSTMNAVAQYLSSEANTEHQYVKHYTGTALNVAQASRVPFTTLREPRQHNNPNVMLGDFSTRQKAPINYHNGGVNARNNTPPPPPMADPPFPSGSQATGQMVEPQISPELSEDITSNQVSICGSPLDVIITNAGEREAEKVDEMIPISAPISRGSTDTTSFVVELATMATKSPMNPRIVDATALEVETNEQQRVPVPRQQSPALSSNGNPAKQESLKRKERRSEPESSTASLDHMSDCIAEPKATLSSFTKPTFATNSACSTTKKLQPGTLFSSNVNVVNNNNGTSGRVAPPQFRLLIERLESWRENGYDRVSRSTIASELLQRDSEVYKKAGVTKFSNYVAAAVKAGIVDIGHDSVGAPWIALEQGWYGAKTN
ncbi:hypothetical protein AX17_004405 [Amanita inopinata Kibby_2008]|nr:hypothetical protein AX17_004405 [Amanita inopinata Kibby_2008]